MEYWSIGVLGVANTPLLNTPSLILLRQQLFQPIDHFRRLIDDFFRKNLQFFAAGWPDFPAALFCLAKEVGIFYRFGEGFAQDLDALRGDAGSCEDRPSAEAADTQVNERLTAFDLGRFILLHQFEKRWHVRNLGISLP